MAKIDEDWFKQWLKDHNYSFWYEEDGNQIWVNPKYTIVWHEAVGLRLQIPNDLCSQEYLVKTFIPSSLAKQV